MSAYRIKPGAIPKHLKPPKQTPRPAGSRPPIRGAKESDAPIKTGWFGLPRRQPAAKGWLARENRRNIAREHPHARLRDPTGLRIYNFVVKASVPGQLVLTGLLLRLMKPQLALVLYFLFFAQAGEQSDIAIVPPRLSFPVSGQTNVYLDPSMVRGPAAGHQGLVEQRSQRQRGRPGGVATDESAGRSTGA